MTLIPSLLAAHLLLQVAPPPCPPPGQTRASLLELKAQKFEVAGEEKRNQLALELLSCLDDPDPAIRDGVVFEGLSTWLRAKALKPSTIEALRVSLQAALMGPKDAAGFRRPFAALVLSEVARTDRIEPSFTESERAALVETAATSLAAVDDYRGFDDKEGWRHGVAHGSDLVLQLALNSRIEGPALQRLMEAVQTQIAPRGEVFYSFGEPERLARAVVFTYRRGQLDAAFWEAWVGRVASPSPLANWGSAFGSRRACGTRDVTSTCARNCSTR